MTDQSEMFLSNMAQDMKELFERTSPVFDEEPTHLRGLEVRYTGEVFDDKNLEDILDTLTEKELKATIETLIRHLKGE